MARLILAAPINPDNTPHGYNWTYAFPMLLFIIIALVLYVLFSRPHRRVPARALTLPVRPRGATRANSATATAPPAAPGEVSGARDAGETAEGAEGTE